MLQFNIKGQMRNAKLIPNLTLYFDIAHLFLLEAELNA